MLLEQIIDAMCLGLYAEFGAGYEIYTEKVEQGLTEPCFLIQCDTVNFTAYPGGRKLMHAALRVKYYPQGESKREEDHAILQRMYDALGLLECPTSHVRASSFSGGIEEEDGILTAAITFDKFFTWSEDTALMAVLSSSFGA